MESRGAVTLPGIHVGVACEEVVYCGRVAVLDGMNELDVRAACPERRDRHE